MSYSQSAPSLVRSQIHSEIESIDPLDALEAEHRADAIAWVASGDELCRLAKPATPPKHLVAYFAVLDDQRILLVDHKNAQLWLPTGGHIEPGEHPRETVSRELFEELGLKASHAIAPPLMITASQTVGLTSGHVDVSLWYVVHFEPGQTIRYDEDEFNSVRWFDLAELPYERSDPHLRRFVEKLRSSRSAQQQNQSLNKVNNSATSNLIGACFCGTVKIRCLVKPKSVINCHCGQCRRLSGAAFTTWVSLPRQATTVSGEAALATFAPTENGLRYFCKHCGGHVYTEDKRIPGILGVPAGILTTALSSNPSGHYFFDNKAEWLACTDSLPKFGGESGMENLPHS